MNHEKPTWEDRAKFPYLDDQMIIVTHMSVKGLGGAQHVAEQVLDRLNKRYKADGCKPRPHLRVV